MIYNSITVEGNIGAGKTTLATMLAEDYKAELILEQFADNPFLPAFYKDPTKNAFPLELFFMAERYQQLQDTIQQELFNQPIISDYLFSKSQLFAKTNLEEKELDLYMRLFRIIHSQLPEPELIVYLHNEVEQLQHNISKRGREYEKDISDAYLQRIEDAYFDHFRQIKNKARILIVKADNLDFVNREIDYLRIKKLLNKEHPIGMTVV